MGAGDAGGCRAVVLFLAATATCHPQPLPTTHCLCKQAPRSGCCAAAPPPAAAGSQTAHALLLCCRCRCRCRQRQGLAARPLSLAHHHQAPLCNQEVRRLGLGQQARMVRWFGRQPRAPHHVPRRRSPETTPPRCVGSCVCGRAVRELAGKRGRLAAAALAAALAAGIGGNAARVPSLCLSALRSAHLLTSHPWASSTCSATWGGAPVRPSKRASASE